MNKKRHRSRLVFDDSPPNEAQKKVEADILALRAVPRGIQIMIQSEVNRVVQEAFRERDARERTKSAKRRSNGARIGHATQSLRRAV